MTVGVSVATAEVPASGSSIYNTANAYAIAETDWGPANQSVPTTNLGNLATAFGTPQASGNPYNSRTTTSAALIDAGDTMFHESQAASPTLYVSRVLGPTPVKATLALAPSSALTLTAQYYGVGGNGILVAVQNNSTNYVLTLYDTLGNILAQSPALSTLAAGVAWCATTGLVTAVSSGSTLPSTASATALAGGTDNRSSATLTNWTSALTYFSPLLGPGQVLAPGQTNTGISGIWSALGSHAQGNNRVALCDMDDNQSVSTLISDLSTFGTSAVASYTGFWAGARNIPGIASGSSRSILGASAIAGLCARADLGGNPNQAAAGVKFPLVYATQPTSLVSGAPYDTYSPSDLNALNAAGINTFQRASGLPTNYGFVSPVLASSDQIYWQFNHSRFRMALVAQAQVLGQPFVFAQIDGQGNQATKFKGALQGMLLPYAVSGALWAPPGTAPADAFTVDTGPDVNTPATQAAGQLNAVLTVSFSYFAQNVQIQINVSPITTS